MRRMLLIGVGLALIALAGAWRLAPEERLPPGWTWKWSFVGFNTAPDEKTGKYPEKDPVTIYYRELKIADEGGRPASVVVEDRYVVKDPASNKTTWAYILRSPVDPRSGRHADPRFPNDILVFPRGVEKTAYSLRMNYAEGVPMRFAREEQVEGLLTYLYAYKGRGEYTKSYAGNADYPGIPVQAGQEIKCMDDQFTLNLWVEPVTGEIVQIEESCLSGDAIFDKSTGKMLAPIMRWGGRTEGTETLKRVADVRALRSRLLWRSTYGPLLLGGVGVLCLGWAAVPRRRTEPAGSIG